ncbi:hypothetical protein N9260_01365 [bacterium]|nr:hypothetical protein [bacterium]
MARRSTRKSSTKSAQTHQGEATDEPRVEVEGDELNATEPTVPATPPLDDLESVSENDLSSGAVISDPEPSEPSKEDPLSSTGLVDVSQAALDSLVFPPSKHSDSK